MNNPTAKPIDQAEIARRLYRIRNIANLIYLCPEEKAESYLLQDSVAQVSEMVQDLIEEMNF